MSDKYRLTETGRGLSHCVDTNSDKNMKNKPTKRLTYEACESELWSSSQNPQSIRLPLVISSSKIPPLVIKLKDVQKPKKRVPKKISSLGFIEPRTMNDYSLAYNGQEPELRGCIYDPLDWHNIGYVGDSEDSPEEVSSIERNTKHRDILSKDNYEQQIEQCNQGEANFEYLQWGVTNAYAHTEVLPNKIRVQQCQIPQDIESYKIESEFIQEKLPSKVASNSIASNEHDDDTDLFKNLLQQMSSKRVHLDSTCIQVQTESPSLSYNSTISFRERPCSPCQPLSSSHHQLRGDSEEHEKTESRIHRKQLEENQCVSQNKNHDQNPWDHEPRQKYSVQAQSLSPSHNVDQGQSSSYHSSQDESPQFNVQFQEEQAVSKDSNMLTTYYMNVRLPVGALFHIPEASERDEYSPQESVVNQGDEDKLPKRRIIYLPKATEKYDCSTFEGTGPYRDFDFGTDNMLQIGTPMGDCKYSDDVLETLEKVTKKKIKKKVSKGSNSKQHLNYNKNTQVTQKMVQKLRKVKSKRHRRVHLKVQSSQAYETHSHKQKLFGQGPLQTGLREL